jgi:hypothetical protein
LIDGYFSSILYKEDKNKELSMTDGFTFWMKSVNVQCNRAFGMDTDFLPDANWRPYYDDDMTPKQAIDEAVMDAWDDMLDMQEIWEDHCSREAV